MTDRSTPLINVMNAGELSPKVDARSDIAKYHGGCLIMEGMIPHVEGGVSRQPGTYYTYGVKSMDRKTIIRPFHFSTVQAYAIEFGHQYIRFYMDNGIIVDGGMTVVEITSPYGEDDLFNLTFCQSADVMYIFHPSYAPRRLTRSSHIVWTLEVFPMARMRPFVITSITRANPAVVTVSKPAWATSTLYYKGNVVFHTSKYYWCTEDHTSGTFSSDISAGLWTLMEFPIAGDVVWIRDVVGMTEVNNLSFIVANPSASGGTFQLSGINSSAYTPYASGGATFQMKFGKPDEYPSCGTFLDQRLICGGSNSHPQRISLSTIGEHDNFHLDGSDDSAALDYTLMSGKVDRIRWMVGEENLIIGTTGGIWRFNVPSTPTTTPPSARKHVHIGVQNIQPQTVGDFVFWVTRSGLGLRQLTYDFGIDKYRSPDMTRIASHVTRGETFSLSGIVDMAYQHEPYPILWAIRKDGALLGFVCDLQENVFAWSRVITDGKFESIAVISKDGYEDQVWVVVNRTVGGVTKRYVEYFTQQDFFGDIRESFYLHSGLSTVDGVRGDISGITRANPAVVNVSPWPTRISGGGDMVNGDRVVIRGVNGMTEINLSGSVLGPTLTPYTVANCNKGAGTFELQGVDSSTYGVYTGGGTVRVVVNSVSGLSHLEGKSVDTLIDGIAEVGKTVSGGAISLTLYGSKIHAGLPFTSIIMPMKLHSQGTGGTQRGKRQRVNKLTACLYQTGKGVKIGPDAANALEVVSLNEGVLTTDDLPFSFPSNWEDEATIYIEQSKPLPLTVLAIVPRWNVNED